jgi:Protein of unknown function (DUF1517)
MNAWNDRFNKLTGKTRFVVSRIFIHLKGPEVPTLLGVLNRAAQDAIDNDGDLYILGQSLTEICENLLQRESSWMSASNEGDAVWSEEEASEYLNELFTDSTSRYLSEVEGGTDSDAEALKIPMTTNLVIMLTIACEGEVPQLETDLADVSALRQALKQLIALQTQNRFRAIQLNFSPDQIGYVLTDDHLMQQFPELIPL